MSALAAGIGNRHSPVVTTRLAQRRACRLALVAFALIAAVTPLPAARTTSHKPSFAEEMLDRIRKLAPSARLEIVDPLSIRANGGTPDELAISFDRIAKFCGVNDPGACEAQKDDYARGMAEVLNAGHAEEITAARLRVMVRSRDYVEAASRAMAVGPDSAVVTIPLGPDLVGVLAADYPRTTRMVNVKDLTVLHLSRDQAIALGTKQVLAEMAPLPDAATLNNQIVGLAAAAYGASYFLATDRWRAIAKGIKGTLWLAIPFDEGVVAGVAKDSADLERLKQIVAQKYETAARGISPRLFVWSDGGWRPLN
jgi:hypothetical protein